MKVGDRVRKCHVFDGGPKIKIPVSKILIVEEILDAMPIDGPKVKEVIAVLSDGSWSFIWNLIPQEKGEQYACKRNSDTEDFG